METRAHHLLIGSFAIGMTVLTVLFLLWIGKIEFNKQHQIYDLHFGGSVAGLSKAGIVVHARGAFKALRHRRSLGRQLCVAQRSFLDLPIGQ